MALSIGLSVNPQDSQWLELAREAERLGADSIWVPEFWAYDAFTPLAAIAAVTERVRLATGIAQLGARTPAMLAMSAMSLQEMPAEERGCKFGSAEGQIQTGAATPSTTSCCYLRA
jgi:alkanesulfonate monooxygenase SsuD/methylene tetrahydromethanopterin reductase-like flavin-dependent oxidoreductase (luciferase family)